MKRCRECGGPMPRRRIHESITRYRAKVLCGRKCQIAEAKRRMRIKP